MNPEDDDLELRLRALQPADVPEPLAQRLREARPRRLPLWLLLGATVGLAALALRLPQPQSAEQNPLAQPPVTSVTQPPPASLEGVRVFLPIQQTSTLVRVEDYGVLETDPARPIQLMRTTWLDDVTYRGDDGVTTLQRQESRTEIIPVALHAY